MSTSAGWNPLTAGCSTKLCCTNNNNKRELLPNQANLVFYSILLRKEREDFLCNVEPTRTSLVVIRVLKVTSRTQMKECVCVSRVCLEEGALKNYYSAIDRRLNLLSNGESSFQTPFEAQKGAPFSSCSCLFLVKYVLRS